MKNSIRPKTYLGHPNQDKIRCFLRRQFEQPDLNKIEVESAKYFTEHPLPIEDFPICEQLYSRTILYRAENGFECMAARWNKGARSVIHGHPMFAFYYVVIGVLEVESFEKKEDEIVPLGVDVFRPGNFFAIAGVPDTFDNAIHRVNASEDSLSLHIYSDNAMKGEVFL